MYAPEVAPLFFEDLVALLALQSTLLFLKVCASFLDLTAHGSMRCAVCKLVVTAAVLYDFACGTATEVFGLVAAGSNAATDQAH